MPEGPEGTSGAALRGTRRRDPRVFFTERRTPFNSRSGPNSALRKAWSRGFTAAGLGDRLIHDFRRSACRNLVQAGVPEPEAMKLTGHKTDRVFRDYNISTSKTERRPLRRLPPTSLGFEKRRSESVRKERERTEATRATGVRPLLLLVSLATRVLAC